MKVANNNDNKYIFEDIAKLLKEYKNMTKKALQLEFEVNNYTPIITTEDMIDTMTYRTMPVDETFSKSIGETSDKTAFAAVSYVEQTNKINILHKHELENSLRQINIEIMRIEYYISLLDL